MEVMKNKGITAGQTKYLEQQVEFVMRKFTVVENMEYVMLIVKRTGYVEGRLTVRQPDTQ